VDNGTVALFIPILALAIPVVVIVVNGLQKFWKFRLEETRLRAGGADSSELEQLRAEVEQLRAELAEVAERLDFTERIVAQSGARGQLPGQRGEAPPAP